MEKLSLGLVFVSLCYLLLVWISWIWLNKDQLQGLRPIKLKVLRVLARKPWR